jgi:hypothetical protein
MIKDGKVKYDTIDIPTLRSLDARILSALDTLEYIYKDDPDISTFLNIKTSILQFHGFTLLFKDKSYEDYTLTPYKASTGSDIGLPQVLSDYSGLIRETPPIKQAPVVTQVVIDPMIQKIQSILGKTTNASVILDSGYYRVTNGSMTFINPRDQLPQVYKFALLFSRDTTTFQDFYVGYSNYTIQINYSTPQQTETLQALFQTIPRYITHIESVLANNPALK